MKAISTGVPPAAGTFHKRPSAPYSSQRPSLVHRARVAVTSAWPVSRMGAAAAESRCITQSWVRSAESGAKKAIRCPSGAKAGARTGPVRAGRGVARPVPRSTSQRRPPHAPRAESATTARWRPSGAHAGSRRSGPTVSETGSSCTSPPAGSIHARRLRHSRETLSGGTSRANAMAPPSGDHAAWPSKPSGSWSWLSWRGAAAPGWSSHRPVRPCRSPRNTMRRPSGDHDGSRSTAVSRTPSVSGRAVPPPPGSSQSWPSRSKTMDRPSGERSKPRTVPSFTRMATVSVEGGRAHAARLASRAHAMAERAESVAESRCRISFLEEDGVGTDSPPRRPDYSRSQWQLYPPGFFRR